MKIQPGSRPDLRHTILAQLYETPFHTLPDCFEELMALPVAEVVADLELILKHEMAIIEASLPAADETADAAFHALKLLGQLKSAQSLPVVLDFFRLPSDNAYAWLGDLQTEDLWDVPLLCGLNQVEALVDFIKDATIDDEYAKVTIFDSLEQMAHHFPEKKEAISNHIYDLLKYFNELPEETFEELGVEFLLASIADGVANLAITRAIPVVKALYKKNRIDTLLRGGWNEFKKELEEEPDTKLSLYEDIRQWYKQRGDFWQKRAENERLKRVQMEVEAAKLAKEKERLSALKELQQKQLQLTGSTKIGRNDPCPCGSGKKFKRCHGD